jgi:hypothetical protein
MQLLPSADFRGRVMSLQTMTWGVTPFSALLMGRMVDAWGAPVVVGSWVLAGFVVSTMVAIASRGLYRNWSASATMA